MSDRFVVVPAAYVVLLRPGGAGAEVLLQLRANTGFRDGHWAVGAAGHVEAGESVLAAAVREAAEELDVVVEQGDLAPLCAMHRTRNTGDPLDERADFFFSCGRWYGEPRRVELHKTADLRWFPLGALPEPVVPHELVVLEGLRQGALPPILVHGFA
ncbi:MAG TPA: NUDIX domain-containing protein [Kineosporiaceae bacterium]|nr:NUDIX domain-containing protein [Kineosporiaceae bacterium]